jgi:hypothetical protein
MTSRQLARLLGKEMLSPEAPSNLLTDIRARSLGEDFDTSRL